MVGYLRLLLAIGVMLSHMSVTLAGYNIGVMSVVVFFLLAGSTTTHVFTTVFAHHPSPLRAFYRDRLQRLFPLYLYTLALVAAVTFSTGIGQPTKDVWPWLLNALIVPLNYFMYFPADVLTEPASVAIPAAWSLGLELQVYALLPLLLLHTQWQRAALVVSVSIYIAAGAGVIDTDIWGYRLLPGTLCIFLLGAYVREHVVLSPKQQVAALALWLVGALFLVVDAFVWDDIRSYRLETLLGLVVGVPLLWALRRLPWRLPGNRWCGDLSYGVFLTHGLAIWLVQAQCESSCSLSAQILLVLALSLVLAIPGVFLSNKLHKRPT